MRPFTDAELARMQAAQESSMMDTCVILRYSAGADDAYGMPAKTWTATEAIRCGYDGRKHIETGVPSGGSEQTQVQLTDGRLRLPLDTWIGNLDRIRLTHRYGAAIDPVTFELAGEPRRGPSGLLCDVKRVTV